MSSIVLNPSGNASDLHRRKVKHIHIDQGNINEKRITVQPDKYSSIPLKKSINFFVFVIFEKL